MSFRCELHPVYGAVPRDGDRVESGQVLGLSADGVATIFAPVAGRVRVVRTTDAGSSRVVVEILPTDGADREAGAGPTSSVLLL